jgi:hypothetical protein
MTASKLTTASASSRYPLLEEILRIKNLPLRPMYSTREVAEVFEVSSRAIQDWAALGKLASRRLPGRARFLPGDLEEFLQGSRAERKG